MISVLFGFAFLSLFFETDSPSYHSPIAMLLGLILLINLIFDGIFLNYERKDPRNINYKLCLIKCIFSFFGILTLISFIYFLIISARMHSAYKKTIRSENQIRCSKCYMLITDDTAKYCPHCGAKIENEISTVLIATQNQQKTIDNRKSTQSEPTEKPSNPPYTRVNVVPDVLFKKEQNVSQKIPYENPTNRSVSAMKTKPEEVARTIVRPHPVLIIKSVPSNSGESIPLEDKSIFKEPIQDSELIDYSDAAKSLKTLDDFFEERNSLQNQGTIQDIGNVVIKSQEEKDPFKFPATSNLQELDDGDNDSLDNNHGNTLESNRLFNELGMRLRYKYGTPSKNQNALDAFNEINQRIQHNRSIPRFSTEQKSSKIINRTKKQPSLKNIEETALKPVEDRFEETNPLKDQESVQNNDDFDKDNLPYQISIPAVDTTTDQEPDNDRSITGESLVKFPGVEPDNTSSLTKDIDFSIIQESEETVHTDPDDISIDWDYVKEEREKHNNNKSKMEGLLGSHDDVRSDETKLIASPLKEKPAINQNQGYDLQFPSDTLKRLDSRYYPVLKNIEGLTEISTENFTKILIQCNLGAISLTPTLDDINEWAEEVLNLENPLLEIQENTIRINMR